MVLEIDCINQTIIIDSLQNCFCKHMINPHLPDYILQSQIALFVVFSEYFPPVLLQYGLIVSIQVSITNLRVYGASLSLNTLEEGLFHSLIGNKFLLER